MKDGYTNISDGVTDGNQVAYTVLASSSSSSSYSSITETSLPDKITQHEYYYTYYVWYSVNSTS
jgi:hypothetical protein